MGRQGQSRPDGGNTQLTPIVLRRLRYYLAYRGNSAVMSNVYVNGGPWESDLIRVMPSLYYHEFEIKVSTADFLADFRKSDHYFEKDPETDRFKKQYVYRHDFLNSVRTHIGSKRIPRPKQFTFVCPNDVIHESKVPKHAGLIYVDTSPNVRGWGVSVVKQPVSLKAATKLSDNNLYKLLRKSMYKARES